MDFFNKIKDQIMSRGSKKNMQDLLILFIIGLIMVLTYNFFTSKEKEQQGYVEVKPQTETQAPVGYEEEMEQKLTDTLSHIEGAGKVKVMIYFQSGAESVPAYSQNSSNSVTEETDSDGGKRITNENTSSETVITTNEAGGSKPFIIEEVKPKISGVIVVAEGAGNPEVKYKLYEAVKTLFNVEYNKVNVYPMKK
ncbi:MAG TPA: stage III sporulation protein AG [Clostridiaceae bacterium]|nr:stage III sporulation protein AG [Clostridiaceae bacterium]